MDNIVNLVLDIIKVVPGPDDTIANIDHEDVEDNPVESEMIKAAMKLRIVQQNGSTQVK